MNTFIYIICICTYLHQGITQKTLKHIIPRNNKSIDPRNVRALNYILGKNQLIFITIHCSTFLPYFQLRTQKQNCRILKLAFIVRASDDGGRQ